MPYPVSHSRIMTELPEYQPRSAPEPLASPRHHAAPTELWSRQALGGCNHLEQNREMRSKPKGPPKMKDQAAGILICTV